MLAIFKTTQQGLEQIEYPVNGCWINAIDPDQNEIERLQSWGIELDLINYSLDEDEMARTERDEDYMLILLRIPCFQGIGADIPYLTTPLGIILTDRYVAKPSAAWRMTSPVRSPAENSA